MAQGNTRAAATARSGGETPLPAGTALALLGKVVGGLLSGSAAPRQLAVCDIDWPASPWAGTPLVASLPSGQPAAPDGPTAQQPTPAAGAEPDAVRTFLGGYVHRWDESTMVASVLAAKGRVKPTASLSCGVSPDRSRRAAVKLGTTWRTPSAISRSASRPVWTPTQIIPAATAARAPLMESSKTTHAAGETPSLAAAAR